MQFNRRSTAPLCQFFWESAANLSLAALWLFFLQRHYNQYLSTSDPRLLLAIIATSITVVMYLTRKMPIKVSLSPFDWAVAVLGTFAPLLFIPRAYALEPTISLVLLMGGTCIQILGLLSLRRSFGIVAAVREVKTSGLYRYVRHPIYLGYLLIDTGYVLGNTTPWNLTVLGLMISATGLRIIREEQILCSDSSYKEYCTRVRWRIVPGVI